jgi:hypothetical protein
MLLMFIAAVAVLMASSGHRKWSWCLKENVHKVLNVLKKWFNYKILLRENQKIVLNIRVNC